MTKGHRRALSTAEIKRQLRNHGAAVGGRVKGLFYVGAITCCELDNGILVGGQVAEEHGNIELVVASPDHLPAEFRTSRTSAPRAMELILLGRKFRGVVGHPKSGDVSLDFGRYRLYFHRFECAISIERGVDQTESHDLAEDMHLSIDDQIKAAQDLARAAARPF